MRKAYGTLGLRKSAPRSHGEHGACTDTTPTHKKKYKTQALVELSFVVYTPESGFRTDQTVRAASLISMYRWCAFAELYAYVALF
jgi:hypothetical protein